MLCEQNRMGRNKCKNKHSAPEGPEPHIFIHKIQHQRSTYIPQLVVIRGSFVSRHSKEDSHPHHRHVLKTRKHSAHHYQYACYCKCLLIVKFMKPLNIISSTFLKNLLELLTLRLQNTSLMRQPPGPGCHSLWYKDYPLCQQISQAQLVLSVQKNQDRY